MPRRSKRRRHLGKRRLGRFGGFERICAELPETVIKTPGCPMIVASPIFAAGPIVTVATSARRRPAGRSAS